MPVQTKLELFTFVVPYNMRLAPRPCLFYSNMVVSNGFEMSHSERISEAKNAMIFYRTCVIFNDIWVVLIVETKNA